MPFLYTANELFDWLSGHPDFVLLDVRNDKDFTNFSVEGPSFFPYINIPYFDFMEDAQGSINLVPKGQKIRIVCAKEGSAKYVADLLCEHGFTDVGYLQQGIVSWGNALVPKKVSSDDEKYTLYQFVRPGKASCSYMLISKDEAMVFDPSRNIEVYKAMAKQHGSKIIRSFETHRQADYISGSMQLAQEKGCKVLASRLDFTGATFPYEPVDDGEICNFTKKGPEVKVLHTPGHTMGSSCYLIDNKYLLSGDTAFISTAGRPDLGGRWAEWARELYLSLMLRLRDLPDHVQVLPGHYTSWNEANREHIFMETLGNLRKHVVAFRLANEKKFAEFIEENMRPQPAVYAEIRKVNIGFLQVAEEEADVMDLGKNECGASNYGKVGVSAGNERIDRRLAA
ncbi:MAG: MBL fold metallo-hydrolase [Proteobacteria bacterium]|nr:MBL fold metallo-hydrolase [Desulfocapsa sp.]MBU3944803.1 MBL fold metallo-hydrolase [Pseudomonadota bacterium]MBU3984783.1 MBL fold metallo-hydrolase [Pseudomonadota bacterium]MBU4029402.1 MBL fold metallo-hydrolase [Pseudomonadota bacterium]MBU4041343.1 MBL fold metallo-hydrolase [Pseudomonadota bacterium]